RAVRGAGRPARGPVDGRGLPRLAARTRVATAARRVMHRRRGVVAAVARLSWRAAPPPGRCPIPEPHWLAPAAQRAGRPPLRSLLRGRRPRPRRRPYRATGRGGPPPAPGAARRSRPGG